MRELPGEGKGVSGILAGVMLFAMLFSVGVGFYIYVNQTNSSVNHANANQQNVIGQSSLENLTLSASVNAGTITVTATNRGGVPTTLISAFVDNSNGILQNPPSPDPFAVQTTGSPSINQPTLDVGQSASFVVPGYTYQLGASVTVSVITGRGNTFTAQYPPPQTGTQTNVVVNSETTTVIATVSGGGSNALVVVMTATPPITFSCTNECVTDSITVYNYALSSVTGVALSPDPPSVVVCGTGNTPGCTATLTLPVCTGPTLSNGQPDTSDSITAYSGAGNAPYVTFECTYDANTGAVGGFATFSGEATGVLSVTGQQVASATSTSNTIEIGGQANVITQGAFTANFLFYKYSACQTGPQEINTNPTYAYTGVTTGTYPCNPTPSQITNPGAMNDGLLNDAFLLYGAANYYVAYYVSLTNDFNQTLPILQYSYLYMDPGISGEQYYFLAGAATDYYNTATKTYSSYYPNYNVANSVPTLDAYSATTTSCAETYNPVYQNYTVPSPSTCINIHPGQTLTLTFAACGWDASTWDWGGTQYANQFDSPATNCNINSVPGYHGNVPEGQVVSIEVTYMYKNHAYSQLLPFDGQFIMNQYTPSVSTLLSSPTIQAGQSVTDSATLSSASPFAGGTVQYEYFTSSTCSGSATNVGSALTVTDGVVPNSQAQTLNSTGSYGWEAVYSGDLYDSGATSPCEPLTVTNASPTISTTLSKNPIGVFQPETDTATLSGAANPSGSVTFTVYSNSACTTQVFTSSNTISGSSATSSSFTPTSLGTYYWEASYPGDSNNNAVSSTCGASGETLTVTKASPTITTSLGQPTGTVTLDPNSASQQMVHFVHPAVTGTITISTTNTNDVVYACEYTETTGLTFGISDTSGLMWTVRGSVTLSSGGELECWYAIASGTLTGDVITFTAPNDLEGMNAMVISVSGANTAAPFDPNIGSSGLGGVSASGSGTSSTVPITTTYSNDLIVGIVGLDTNPTGTGTAATAGGAFTLLDDSAVNTASSADEYLSVSTPQSGLGVGFTWSGSLGWVTMADAFVPPHPIPSIPVGSSITDTATLVGAGNPSGSVTFTVYSNSACTTQIFTSSNTISGSSATSSSFTPTSAGTYYWEASYPGDANNSPASSTCGASGEILTVTTNLGTPSISTTTPSIDVGQSASLSVSWPGGTSPFTVTLYYTSSSSSCASLGAQIDQKTGVAGSPSSFSESGLTTGTDYICATVKDSSNPAVTTTTASPVTVTVHADPTVAVTPIGPLSYLVGHSASALTATVTYSGPNTASIEWYSSTTSSCSSSSTNLGVTTATYTPSTSATGTTYYCAVVSDSGVTGYSYASNAVEVTVNPALSGVTLGSMTTNPVGVGQSDSVSVSWSGGASTYTVTLYYSTSSTSCSSANTQAAQSTGVSSSPTTMTFTAPSSAGTYYYCATVTDSASESAASSTSGTSLTVNAITATLTLNPNSGPVGTTTTLSGGGYADNTLYAYCFSSSGTSACPSGTTTTFTTTAGGAIPAGVTIVVPHSGHDYVDVNQGNTGTNFVISAPFTIQANLVQAKTLCGDLTVSTCDVALGSSVTAGDELVVTVSTELSTSGTCITVNSITETSGLGGSFTSAGSVTAAYGTTSCVYTNVFYVTLTGSGADTISVTLSGAPTSAVVQAYEVSGVAATPTEVQGSCTTSSCITSMSTNAASYSSYSFIAAAADLYPHHISTVPSIFTTEFNQGISGDAGFAGYGIPTAGATGATFGMTPYTGAGNPNSWAEEVVIFAPDASPTALVSCAPTSLPVGSASNCTATLTGFSGTVTGETVTWTQTGGTGSVSFSAGTCALTAGGSCFVTVTGLTPGKATIQASYPGDTANAASQNSRSVTVTGKYPAALMRTRALCAEYDIPSSGTATTFPATSNGKYTWVDAGAVFTGSLVAPSAQPASSVVSHPEASLDGQQPSAHSQRFIPSFATLGWGGLALLCAAIRLDSNDRFPRRLSLRSVEGVIGPDIDRNIEGGSAG